MKNREKYAEDIKNLEGGKFCDDFIKPIILKKDSCFRLQCSQCAMIRGLWLDEEYVEPTVEVDWSRVKVDTPIHVRPHDSMKWNKRHFARYEEGIVYAWAGGKTSFTIDEESTSGWTQAKLPTGVKPEDVYEDGE